MATSNAVAIALDWGSTRLRAYALDASYAVLEQRAADTGVFNVPNRAFESTLRALIGAWLDAHPQIPLFAAGMIGSVNGWAEAAYARTPANAAQLRAQCLDVPFEHSHHTLRIVPGVRHGAGSDTDVMRGEETQIFGVLDQQTDALFCLPGTHCKWVIVANGTIESFVTHYTGELYQWLSTQSGVSKVIAHDAPFDGAAFDEAAQWSQPDASELLHRLFTLRAAVVARERTGAWAASAAQGLLIGADVAQGLKFAQKYLRRNFLDLDRAPQIEIVGTSALCALYSRVLARAGHRFALHSADATVKGLAKIFG